MFFSADCPCFRAHEARLAALARAYEPRKVRFLLVDSEVDASLERDAVLSRERGLGIPIVIDANAVLADALAAEYATYSVVLDRAGTVRFRGGIDSDKSHLRADATPYLGDALDDSAERKCTAATRGQGPRMLASDPIAPPCCARQRCSGARVAAASRSPRAQCGARNTNSRRARLQRGASSKGLEKRQQLSLGWRVTRSRPSRLGVTSR